MTRLESISVDPHFGESLKIESPRHAYPTAVAVPPEWTLEAKYTNGEVRVIRGPSRHISEIARAGRSNLIWHDTPVENRVGWEEPKLPLELA